MPVFLSSNVFTETYPPRCWALCCGPSAVSSQGFCFDGAMHMQGLSMWGVSVG